MSKSAATNPRLEKVGSHTVSTEYGNGGDVSREECYPVVLVTWRGQEIRAQFEATRYVSSAGWSEWRIFARNCDPGVSDLARAAINEVGRPIIEAWIKSGGYTTSRQTAFAWMIRHKIREERYSADNPATVLAQYGHELTPEDRGRFADAIEHLRALLALVA